MTCLLDANIFIQAKNLHYGFDFCPAFWDWLAEQNRDGRFTPTSVGKEYMRLRYSMLLPSPPADASYCILVKY